MSWTDDAELLEGDPRASTALNSTPCGGGIRQPYGAECHETGTWGVLRASGRPYQHTYCTVHAAARLRAIERLQLMAQAARALRERVRCG